MIGLILAFWFIGGVIIGAIIGWTRKSLKKATKKESPLLIIDSHGTVSIPHSQHKNTFITQPSQTTHPAVQEIVKKAQKAGL